MAQPRIVQRDDARFTRPEGGFGRDERATGGESIGPQVDVGRQPAVADVGPVLVVGEVQAAAQAAAFVAQEEVFAVRLGRPLLRSL